MRVTDDIDMDCRILCFLSSFSRIHSSLIEWEDLRHVLVLLVSCSDLRLVPTVSIHRPLFIRCYRYISHLLIIIGVSVEGMMSQ